MREFRLCVFGCGLPKRIIHFVAAQQFFVQFGFAKTFQQGFFFQRIAPQTQSIDRNAHAFQKQRRNIKMADVAVFGCRVIARNIKRRVNKSIEYAKLRLRREKIVPSWQMVAQNHNAGVLANRAF